VRWFEFRGRCRGQARNAGAGSGRAERDLVPACLRVGVGLLPYFPLASGLLTGKYRRDAAPPAGARLAGRQIPDATYDRLEALQAFAAERGHSLLELAIAGLAARPGASSVIAGATSTEQVRANAAAIEWQLSSEEEAALKLVLA